VILRYVIIVNNCRWWYSTWTFFFLCERESRMSCFNFKIY